MQKLYVLVRKDLRKNYQAVQAGHALAEFLITQPNHRWENGTLIYLTVKDEEELKRWYHRLNINGYQFAIFREPDLNFQLTALCTNANEELFLELPLL